MSRTDRQLARLLRAEEPPEPPPELLETLRRDIPHLPPAPRHPKGKVEELHPRPFLGWMAAAASVVIALGAGMLALRVAQQSPPPGDAAAVAPYESITARAVPETGVAAGAPEAGTEAEAGAPPVESAPQVADARADRDGALERLRAAAPILPPAEPPPAAADDLGAVAFGIVEETGEDREGAERGDVSLRLEEPEADAGAAGGVETRRQRASNAPAPSAPSAPAPPAAKAVPPASSAEVAARAPQGIVGGVVAGGVVHRAAADRPVDTEDDRRSTFSLDVGSGSYEAVRRHLEAGRMPPAETVRIEEIVNAFAYRDPAPAAADLAVHAEGARSPWARAEGTHLLRIAVRAREARPGDPRPGIVADAARAQVEFDPRWVSRWRLLGHEAGALADERFRREAPLGGALAAGRAVTAVYEVELQPRVPSSARLALVRLRWRPAGAAAEVETERVVRPADLAPSWEAASGNLRLASVAARFGELLADADRGAGAQLAELARLAETLAAESPGEPRIRELARLVALARDVRGGGG